MGLIYEKCSKMSLLFLGDWHDNWATGMKLVFEALYSSCPGDCAHYDDHAFHYFILVATPPVVCQTLLHCILKCAFVRWIESFYWEQNLKSKRMSIGAVNPVLLCAVL